jgi:hypothetical protein
MVKAAREVNRSKISVRRSKHLAKAACLKSGAASKAATPFVQRAALRHAFGHDSGIVRMFHSHTPGAHPESHNLARFWPGISVTLRHQEAFAPQAALGRGRELPVPGWAGREGTARRRSV